MFDQIADVEKVIVGLSDAQDGVRQAKLALDQIRNALIRLEDADLCERTHDVERLVDDVLKEVRRVR